MTKPKSKNECMSCSGCGRQTRGITYHLILKDGVLPRRETLDDTTNFEWKNICCYCIIRLTVNGKPEIVNSRFYNVRKGEFNKRRKFDDWELSGDMWFDINELFFNIDQL